MQIIEDDDQGTRSGNRFVRAADGPERLIACRHRLGHADQGREALANEASALTALQCGGDLRSYDLAIVSFDDACGLLDRLRYRPERDPLAIWEATTPQHHRVLPHETEELVDESRLPHAGGPQEREEVARAVCDRLLQCRLEQPKLALATDEG